MFSQYSPLTKQLLNKSQLLFIGDKQFLPSSFPTDQISYKNKFIGEYQLFERYPIFLFSPKTLIQTLMTSGCLFDTKIKDNLLNIVIKTFLTISITVYNT